MKKFISMLICLTMLLSIGSVSVLAAVTEYTTDELSALNLEYPLVEIASKNDLVGTVLEYTPEKYMFKVANSTDTKGYVLLKNVNAGANDGYFVMVADTGLTTNTSGGAIKTFDASYPGIASDNTSDTSKLPQKQFEADKTNSVAYYLNTEDYINAQFPDLKAYINTHKWYVERTQNDSLGKAYSTESKIALLSTTEYQANIDRIGVKSRIGSADRFILRTPHWTTEFASHKSNPSYKSHAVWTVVSNGGMNASPLTYYWICSERPCFYLSEDFFRKVKLDMTYLTGADSEVGKLIKKLAETGETPYTEAELAVIASAEITSSNGNKLYTTLTAPTVENATYQWLRDGVNVSGATNSTYTTVYADLGTAVSCKITIGDLVVTTPTFAMEGKPTLVQPSSNVFKYTVETTNDSEYERPDENYVFNLAGEDGAAGVKFILLKSVNAEEDDGYFILRDMSVNGSYFYQYGEEDNVFEYIYDPTDSKSIASVINTETYWNKDESGSAPGVPVIPQAMQPYLETHRWWNEGNIWNDTTTNPYAQDPFTTESKVAVISSTEVAENASRIGYKVDGANTSGSQAWIMRTAMGSKSGNPTSVEMPYVDQRDTAPWRLSRVSANSSYYAKRICFYLSPEFFKKVKLDIANMGANVKAMVKEELGTAVAAKAVGYSTDEIKALGFDIEDFSVTAKIDATDLKAGTTVTGTATIVQKDLTPRTVEIIVAAYDSNNTLVGAELISKKYTEEDNDTFTVPVPLELEKDASYVKCYVWNDQLTPLMEVPVQYPAE